MSGTPKTCASIACERTATHKLTYTFPGDRNTSHTELVCEVCGQEYLRRPSLQASLEPLPRRRSRKPNKLFIFKGVLTDYTSGMIVVLAPDVESAITQIEARKAAGEFFPGDLLDDMRHVTPEVHEVTAGSPMVIEYVSGGG